MCKKVNRGLNALSRIAYCMVFSEGWYGSFIAGGWAAGLVISVGGLLCGPGQDMWDKLWGFCEIAHCGKGSILFSISYLLVLTKLSFWEGEWALGYNSIRFWSLESFGNSWDNSYVECLLLIITIRFTCGEMKICKATSLKILWPRL